MVMVNIFRPIASLIDSLTLMPASVAITTVVGGWMLVASTGYAFGLNNWPQGPVNLVDGLTLQRTPQPASTSVQCIGVPCAFQYSLPETFWYPGSQCYLECRLFGGDQCYDLLQTQCSLYLCKNGYYWVNSSGNTFVGCTTDSGNSYTHPCPNGTCYP